MATATITVPDALVPRLAAAVRALYPSATGDARDAAGNLIGTPLPNGQAIKAGMMEWARSTVSSYESSQKKAEQTNAATLAGQQAWADFAVIT